MNDPVGFSPVVLETDRLPVRQWVPDDWRRLLPVRTDPRVLRHLTHSSPWTEERTRHFIDGGIERSRDRGWARWPVVHKENA